MTPIQRWANNTRFAWLNRFLNRLIWGPPDESPPDHIEAHMEVGEERTWR